MIQRTYTVYIVMKMMTRTSALNQMLFTTKLAWYGLQDQAMC